MKIIDLAKEHKSLYFVCLEDWSEDKNVFLAWGIADALFIDNKQARTGPPPSYDKIKKMMAKKVSKL